MPFSSANGASKMPQILLTLLFALVLSLLTFAGSFAEAPRSEFMPTIGAQQQR